MEAEHSSEVSMNPELKKLLFQAINIAVVGAVVSAFNWLSTHGYLTKADVEAVVATGVEQITAQTNEQTEVLKVKADEQTEVLAAETKMQAVKTRQKVVEETNEVIDVAEVKAAERVEAAPMRAQATDPAIAELLLELTARLDKLESGKVTP